MRQGTRDPISRRAAAALFCAATMIPGGAPSAQDRSATPIKQEDEASHGMAAVAED